MTRDEAVTRVLVSIIRMYPTYEEGAAVANEVLDALKAPVMAPDNMPSRVKDDDGDVWERNASGRYTYKYLTHTWDELSVRYGPLKVVG